MKRSAIGAISLVFAFFLAAFPALAQSQFPSSDSTLWVATSGNRINGDRDQTVVLFFEVPDSTAGSLYFCVNNPGNPSATGNSPFEQGGSGTSYWSLIGGTGALSSANSQLVTYDPYPSSEALDGVVLAAMTRTTEDEGWVYFPAVSPSQGEHIGNKYYFKLVLRVDANVGKNAFQADLSSTTGGSPAEIANAKSFAFAWSPMMSSDTALSGRTWNLYAFVPSGTTGNLTVNTWDVDNSPSNAGREYNISGTDLGAFTLGGDSATGSTSFAIGSQTNGSWRTRLLGSVGSTASDLAEAWHTNGSTPLRTYSSSVGAQTANHVALSYNGGSLPQGGSGQATIQAVDASGNPQLVSVKVWIQASGSAQILSSSNTSTALPASGALVTTDGNGLAWVNVGDSAAETSVVSALTNGSNGSDTLAGSNTSVSLVFSPGPLLVSASGSSFTSAGTQSLPTATISNNSSSLVSAANGIYLRIPPSLGLSFSTAVPSVGGSGASGYSGYSYPTPSVLKLNFSTPPSGTQTITVGNLGIVVPANASCTGSLQLSYDGGASYPVSDSATIAVNTVGTYTWDGSSSSSWTTAANWAGGVVPPINADVLIPSSGVTNEPWVDAWIPAVHNLTVQTGRTLTTDTIGITANGSVTIGGSIVGGSGALAFVGNVSGGGSLTASSGTTSIGGNLTVTGLVSNGGTIVFNGSSAQSSNGYATFNNVQKTGASTLTMAGAATIGGTLTIASGSVFDAASYNFSVASLANSGVFALDGSQATQTITSGAGASGIIRYKGASGGTVRLASFYDLDIGRTGASFALGAGITVAHNLSVTAGTLSMTTFGATIGGALSINGMLSQTSGALAVTGLTTVAVGAGNSIALNAPGNNFSTVAVGSALDVQLTDANAIILGASTVSGALTVNAVGISQSGALSVSGAASFTGAAGAIALGNASNAFGSTVALFNSGANNVALTDNSPLSLAASSLGSGTLTLVSAGAIIQTGALVASGATTVTATGPANVTLNNGSNDFGTLSIAAGLDVSVADANAIQLGASSVSGTLTVSAAGAITQSGAISAAILAVTDTGADTLLDSQSNSIAQLGAIGAAGRIFALDNGVALSQVTSTSIAAAGLRLLGSGSYTLTNTGNQVTTLAASTSADLSYRDTDGLAIGTVTGTATTNGIAVGAHAVTLQTGAALSQTQPISASSLILTTVGGASLGAANAVSSFTATNSGSGALSLVNTAAPLTIGGIGQYAGGTVSVQNTGAVVLSGSVSSGSGGSVAIGTGGAGTLSWTAGTITADTINLQTTASSLGQIGASGSPVLTAAGSASATTLNLGQGSSLAGAYVSHTGALALGLPSISTNAPLRIQASGVLTLPAPGISTGSGNLYLRSGGALATNGALSSTGTLSLIADSGLLGLAHTVSGGAVVLTSSASSISQTAGTVSGSSLTASAATGITMPMLNAAAAATLSNATSGDIQYSNNLAMTLAATNGAAAGIIAVTNATGTLATSGTINTASGAANISLQTAGAMTIGNAVTAGGTGTVSLASVGLTNSSTVTGPGGVSIDAGTGSFTNAAGGTVTNGGGSASLGLVADSMDLSASGSIAGNSGSVAISPKTIGRAISLGGGATGLGLSDAELDTVTTSGSLSLSATGATGTISTDGILSRPVGSGALSLQSAAGGISLGAFAVSSQAALSLTTTGAITMIGAGSLAAGGNLTLDAVSGIGSIGLSQPVRLGTVSGNVSATNSTGGDLYLTTSGAVTLGTSAFSLSERSGGALRVDSSGVLTIAGNLSVLGSGSIELNATGGIVEQSAGAGTLGASTVRLGASAATASVGASGVPILTAATSLLAAASTAGPIWLSNAGVLADASVAATGGLVNLHTSGALTLSSGNIASASSTVTIVSGGLITISSGRNVTAGAASLLSISSIGLSNSGSLTGPGGVSIDAGAATLTNAASGQITNGGGLSAAAVSLTADKMALLGSIAGGAGRVSLLDKTGGLAFDLGSMTDAAAGTVELSDPELKSIGTTGFLSIGNASSGAITVSSPVAPTGAPKLHLTSSGGIASAAAADTITATSLAASAGTAVNLYTVAGSVAARAGSGALALSDSGSGLTIGSIDGETGLSTVNQAITLTKTMVGGIVISNAINSGSADCTIDSSDAVTQGAAITANGLRLLGAGGYDLSLATGNSVSILAASVSGGAVSFRGSGAYSVGSLGGTNGITLTGSNAGLILFSVAGDLSLSRSISTSSGAITIWPAIVLGADVSVGNGGGTSANISFRSTLSGAHTLDVTAGGSTFLVTGAIGGPALSALTVHSATTATFGAGVTTSGVQSVTAGTIYTNGVHSTTNSAILFTGKLELQADTTLSVGSSTIGVTGNINGAHSFTANATGLTTLGGSIGTVTALTALTTDSGGGTSFGATLNTAAGAVSIADQLQLSGNATIDTTNSGGSAAGEAISIAGIAGNSHTLDLNAGTGGALTVGAAADAPSQLSIVNSNGATFSGNLGTGTAGALVIATSQQTGVNIAFGAPTHLTSFDSPAGSTAYNLSFAGGLTIDGAVVFRNGGSLALGNGATFSGGATAVLPSAKNLAAAIVSVGGFDFSGSPVVLTADTTIQAGANAVKLGGTLNSLNAAARSLTVQATSGTTTLGGAVGGAFPLSALSISGPTEINGAAVSTSGAQTYSGSADLGASATLSGTTVSFGANVTGGGHSLAISGNAVIGSASGDSLSGASSLSVSGATTINAGSVATTGAGGQTYTGAVTLGSSSALVSGPGPIGFGSTLGESGSRTLTIQDASSTGTVTFSGSVSISGLATGSGAFSVVMRGASNSIAGSTSFLNSGGLTLGDAITDAFTFTAGLSAVTAGANNFQGTVSSSGNIALNGLSVSGSSLVLNAVQVGVTTLNSVASGRTLTINASGATGATITTASLSGDNAAGDVSTSPSDTAAANNGRLDLASSNFSIGTLNSVGILRLTGLQSTHSIGSGGAVSGIIEYYDGSGNGTVFDDMGSGAPHYYHLRINGSARSFTLGGSLEVAGDVILDGSTLASSSYTLTVDGYWINNLGSSAFSPGSGTVSFAASASRLSTRTVRIYGDNIWWIFWCADGAAGTPTRILFENNRVQRILSGGIFHIYGYASGQRIVLERMTDTGTHDMPPSPILGNPNYWYFNLVPGGSLEMQYVDVYSSNAAINPVAVPADVNATEDPPYYCFKWLKRLYAIYSYTEDSDYDGKIDRIRVTTEAAVDDDFSGFVAEVNGYDIDTSKGTKGYARPSLGTNFYIYLVEKPYLDTGVMPGWRIVKNTSLVDDQFKQQKVATIAQAVGTDSDWMATADTAWPVIGYTLALPGLSVGTDTFIHASEPLVEAGGNAPTAADFGLSSMTPVTYASSGNGVSEAVGNAPTAPSLANLADGSNTLSFAAGLCDDLPDPGTPAPFPQAPYWAAGYFNLVKAPPAPTYPPSTGYSANPNSYGDEGAPTPTQASPQPDGRYTTRPTTYKFALGNGAYPKTSHRASDLLVSVPPSTLYPDSYFVWPIWAKDQESLSVSEADIEAQTTAASSAAGGIGLIRAFDGSQWLRDQDIRLQARLDSGLAGTVSGIALNFDSRLPDALVSSSGLWLPAFDEANSSTEAGFSGLVPYPDKSPKGRGVSSIPGSQAAPASANLWNFDIDSGNPRVVSVSTLGFFFTLTPAAPAGQQPLYGARLDVAAGEAIPAAWYRLVKPFAFDIHDIRPQKGSVTVLNNVIDPTKGETARLSYQIATEGAVTITVFTLDGNVVRRLYSGSRAVGDYSTAWDGKNLSGATVSRGVYFIRVVGPGIDEIRKVMVVRKP